MAEEQSPEEMLQRMDQQLLSLVNDEELHDGNIRLIQPVNEDFAKFSNKVDQFEDPLSKDAGVSVRRRSIIDFFNFLDNDVNLSDHDDFMGDGQRCGNLGSSPYSPYVPLKAVFSDELSMSSFGSRLDVTESMLSTLPVSSKTKYHFTDIVTSHTSQTSQTDSCTHEDQKDNQSTSPREDEAALFHDAVDAIREEASKMETAFAVDKLHTLESELRIMKKLLHVQAEQISHLKREVYSKEEALALMQLERDLFQADAEAFGVSVKVASKDAQHLAESSTREVSSSNPPIDNEVKPTTLLSPNKLSEIRNLNASDAQQPIQPANQAATPPSIAYIATRGSAFTPLNIVPTSNGTKECPSRSPLAEPDAHDSAGRCLRDFSREDCKDVKSEPVKKPNRFRPIVSSARRKKETSAAETKVPTPAAVVPVKGSALLSAIAVIPDAAETWVPNSVVSPSTIESSILASSTDSSSCCTSKSVDRSTSSSASCEVIQEEGEDDTADLSHSLQSQECGRTIAKTTSGIDAINRDTETKNPFQDVTSFERNLGTAKQRKSNEPNQTRICGASLFRRLKARQKVLTTKRQSRQLAHTEQKEEALCKGQSLQAQVEELAQRLRSSVEGSEDLRKRLAMISRYYETTVHSLHENIQSLKKEQASMQADLTKQINSIDRERLVVIKQNEHYFQKEQERGESK